MGEIADWMVEQMLLDAGLERAYFERDDEVEEYLYGVKTPDLILEAKEVLAERRLDMDKPLVEKITSILGYFFINREITQKQRYALGSFIVWGL